MYLIVCLLVGILLFTHKKTTLHNPKDLNNTIEKLYPSEEYFMMKQFPEVKFHIKAFEKAINMVKSFIQTSGNRTMGIWADQGPGNIGARANSIAINPLDSNVMLLGYSEGGLFRTSDGGKNWNPVFDDQSRLSIGEVVFDPINSSIAYAGTGDPNVSGFPFIGDGIYKSNDGGITWNNIGLQETKIISQIRISKQNNNIIYVSAMGIPFEKNNHRGVYKSVNGGQSWQQILFVNDSTGIADLVIHPTNHNIIYATGWNRIRNNYTSLVSGPDARIYKSIDGGINWTILTGGLPEDASSRIGIDISQSNPNVLYACYAEAGNFNLKGVYKSVDGGSNWVSLELGAASGLLKTMYSGFGWYFGKIRINPTNQNDVFILGVDMFRTLDGGISWLPAVPNWWTYEVHADKHDLIFSGSNMYLTTDGGAYKADINTSIWTDIENIPTTQFYRVGYNPNKPDLYYGGAQDNGTSGGNKLTFNEWERIFGGDGFQPLFHPSNPNIFYCETQNGSLVVTNDGGLSFEDANLGIDPIDPRNWDMPIMMSHHNPDVLYTGTNRIYRNASGSNEEWKAISPDLTDPQSGFLRHNISTIHESPLDSNLLIAGTSDGLLWVTDDSGFSWNLSTNGLPRKYISSVIFSPTDQTTIYVSYTGYKDNDNTPYIYRSDDVGKTWKAVSGNMPKIAINNILALPLKNKNIDALFVATDAGVFYTKSGGFEWQRMGSNMPLITVYDLDYNVELNQIVAGTFGRSIQTFDLDQIGYPETVSLLDRQDYSGLSVAPSIFKAGEILHILNPKELKGQFNILDKTGRSITSFELKGSVFNLELCNVTPGIYFITDKNKKTKAIKFVII